MKEINVYALPGLAFELPPDGVSVAIDVLRATTTITTALASGAARVLPFETVEEAFAAKKAILARYSEERRPEEAASVLLGGERGGLPISGFDLGNSPDLYVPSTVANKTILFTTTNGTRAILSCRGVVLAASFLNTEVVVSRLLREGKSPISLVCAGTDGQYTEEDLALAGLIVDRLTLREVGFQLNVQAEVAREQWRQRRETPLVEILKSSRGGQNLKRVKLTKDIVDAAKLDSLDVVPEFRVGELRLDSNF